MTNSTTAQAQASSRAFASLTELIQGGRPLIYIQSPEEARIRQLLNLAAGKLFPKPIPVWTWSLTAGLCPPTPADGESSPLGPRAMLDFIAQHKSPAIFQLKDFHEFIRNDSEVRRCLRDIYELCMDTGKFVIITSPIRVIPEEIDRQIAFMTLGAPDLPELIEFLRLESEGLTGKGFTIDRRDETLFAMARALQGLTLDEARHVLRRALSGGSALDFNALPRLLEEKKLLVDEYQEVPGWYAGYTLGGPQIFGKEGFLPPTKTIGEDTRVTLAGVDVQLIPVAGETADVLFVWLPNKKVLIEIAIPYEAFPAISTTRGSRQRDPLDYVNSLKVGRSLNPEYLVALHGPNPITRGTDEVRSLLTDFSDAIQFLNDQTVQYLNRGFRAGEMKDEIQLPDHLASNRYLQETYGSKDWDIFHIFRYYRGYYTGAVRDLFPQSTESEAEMSAFLAASGGDLASSAKAALEEGKLEWALRIADDALVLDPGNAAAFETKNAAMLALAEGTMNSQARNMLLSATC